CEFLRPIPFRPLPTIAPARPTAVGDRSSPPCARFLRRGDRHQIPPAGPPPPLRRSDRVLHEVTICEFPHYPPGFHPIIRARLR
uniref:Uncharacterized protein n=1 Tax=Aegilops tauschii subsp. strangulata TaxID=200361 RepID=A0A453F772_AEGTS